MLKDIISLYRVMHDYKLSMSEKERLIERRLREVLVTAYAYVPYYRKMMQDINYNPKTDFSGPKDLTKFPITTKEILKKYGTESFIREDVDISKLFSESTSGSTGIPLKIYKNHTEKSFKIAKWLRALLLNGYSFRYKTLSLTSPSRLKEGKSILQRFGLLRRLPVNYLAPASEVADIVLKYEPEVIYGNRSNIDLLALEFLSRGIKPEKLKLLLVGSEIIGEDHRELYKNAFGADLIEFYGSVEMGTMAHQIQGMEGLLLCDDLIFFEFLDEYWNPVPPGKPGRVVVTDLIGKTMPLIRYDQGDRVITGKFHDNHDGIQTRILKVMGRDEDRIILRNGITRSALNFNDVMKKHGGIIQYRIIQKTQDLFKVNIYSNGEYFRKEKTLIRKQLKEQFPGYCRFDIELVGPMMPDPSGKLRRFISELKSTTKK